MVKNKMENLVAVVSQTPNTSFNPRIQQVVAGVEPYENIEVPSRETLIGDFLKENYKTVIATKCGLETLLRVSSYGFIDFLQNPPKQGLIHKSECKGYLQNSDEYVWVDKNVFDATWKSASVAILSSDIILSPDVKSAYGLCRPPGHHAAHSKMGGFCYFNNVALAAFSLREQDLKIGILDLDRHVGNGTYELVLREDSIYFVSVHPISTYPWEPYFNESRDNVLSIPIEDNAGSDLFFESYTKALDYLIDCDVDLIIVSLGLDCSIYDLEILEEKGSFGLYPADFYKAGSLVASTGKKVLALQEGGYNLDYLIENLGCFLKGVQNTD